MHVHMACRLCVLARPPRACARAWPMIQRVCTSQRACACVCRCVWSHCQVRLGGFHDVNMLTTDSVSFHSFTVLLRQADAVTEIRYLQVSELAFMTCMFLEREGATGTDDTVNTPLRLV